MTAGSPYRYLWPETWRKLLVRAAIFRAVASRLGDISNAVHDRKEYGEAIKTALQLLYQTSDSVAGNADKDCLAVAEVVRQWLFAIEEIANVPNVKKGATRLLSRLRELLSPLEETCAGGAISDPFRDLFEAVVEHAKVIYNTAWRPVSFSLLHLDDHPRPPGGDRDPYALTAATTVRDQVEVELQVCPAEFGPETYAAIPMMLVHECVCHVPARQDETRNTSIFAEGFVDWAAVFFFDMWMPLINEELSPAAKHHAYRLNVIRQEKGRSAWAQRISGHLAAESLMAWFQTKMGYPAPVAQMKVAQLAVQLNQVSARLERKDQFVSELHCPLSPELQAMLRGWTAGTVPASALLSLPLDDLPR